MQPNQDSAPSVGPEGAVNAMQTVDPVEAAKKAIGKSQEWAQTSGLSTGIPSAESVTASAPTSADTELPKVVAPWDAPEVGSAASDSSAPAEPVKETDPQAEASVGNNSEATAVSTTAEDTGANSGAPSVSTWNMNSMSSGSSPEADEKSASDSGDLTNDTDSSNEGGVESEAASMPTTTEAPTTDTADAPMTTVSPSAPVPATTVSPMPTTTAPATTVSPAPAPTMTEKGVDPGIND